MNWNSTITTAPYNTLNLPSGEEPNLINPQIPSNQNFQLKKQESTTKNIYERSDRVPLGNENNFYDPTKEMVNDYLKTNKSMYDNRGKYFDTYLFNQKFDQYIKEKNDERLLKEKVQLYDLDRVENIQIQPYDLPLNKLLINFKNVWFSFFDKLIQLKNPLDKITTNDMFYYGITFIVIFILYIMLSYIFD